MILLEKIFEQIGGDTVDLALSAPFIPKAIKASKNLRLTAKLHTTRQF